MDTLTVKTFAVEYEWQGRVWQTVVEAYSIEEAKEQFRSDNPHVDLRECWGE